MIDAALAPRAPHRRDPDNDAVDARRDVPGAPRAVRPAKTWSHVHDG
jgi:hypothetical protein